MTGVPRVNPDLFRKQVGRYGDRFYIDPLPECDLADYDPDWQAPSVSLIKKATGKDWSQVNLQRVARFIADERPDELMQADAQYIRDLLQAQIDRVLNRASERGTHVHSMFEAHADGLDPATVELSEDARRWSGSVHRTLQVRKPTVALSEFVCLSRTHGYGGTGDSVWFLPDPDGQEGYWLVDYKSRETHNLYIEECWQLGAYARADYWISARFDESGELVHERMEPLPLLGGLLISITPDDHRIYEIDLDLAFEGFLSLLDLWKARARGASSMRRRVWPDAKPTRNEWIRQRIDVVKSIDIAPLLRQWPESVPKPKKIDTYTDEHVDLLIPVLDLVERAVEAPFPEPDPDPPGAEPEPELLPEPEPEAEPEIDEGDLMPTALPVIRKRFGELSQAQASGIDTIVKQAADANVPIRVAEQPTARRVFLARALILAAERRVSQQTLWALIESIVGTVQGEVPLGEALGRMGWEQASVLAGLVSMAAPAEHDEPVALEPVAATVATPPSVWDDQTKDQLKFECRDRGLPVSGTKQDLIDRLTAADQ